MYRTIIGILVCGVWLITCKRQARDLTTTSSEIASEHQTTDLVGDSTFTSGVEGPAVSENGEIYAVNFERQGTIGKITASGAASLFITLPDSSIGNGIRFLSNGDMIIADYTRHNILRVDMSTGVISEWVHEPRMNQPNDLAVTSTDIIFASDPNWAQSTGQLWRIDPQGTTTLLEGDMGTTNGLEVSPDDRTLYVNESVSRKVWAYDLSPQGDISNKRLLLEFPDYGMDGMRCDSAGNLYITRYGKGSVAVVSPQGKIINEYFTKGKNTTNIAFGGPDGKTCYITVADRGSLEVLHAKLPGRSWVLNH